MKSNQTVPAAWLMVICLVAATPALSASVQLIWPEDGATIHDVHPPFDLENTDMVWDGRHNIQISTDSDFTNVIDEDTVAVVTRYVPTVDFDDLSTGSVRYWWRVKEETASWQDAEVRSFVHAEMPYRVTVPNNASESVFRAKLEEAIGHTPSKLLLAPGGAYEYHPAITTGLFNYSGFSDLIIDGNGSTITIGENSRLFRFTGCDRIAFKNFSVRYFIPGYTMGVVESVNPDDSTMILTPREGWHPDLLQYYKVTGGTSAYVVRYMDPYYTGLFEEWDGWASQFSKHLDAASLEDIGDSRYRLTANAGYESRISKYSPGDLVKFVSYRFSFIVLDSSRFCSISNAQFISFPSSPAMSGNCSGMSIIGLTVRKDRDVDVFGGHSWVNSGEVGQWLENCHFGDIVDDGPALTRTYGENRDYVFRNCTVTQGAHAGKFNGIGAWYSGNHFENTSGSAIYAGFQTGTPGPSANNVLVEDCTFVNCGSIPILCETDKAAWPNYGYNFRISNNKILKADRRTAMLFQGITNLTVNGNFMECDDDLQYKSWIVLRSDVSNYRIFGNTYECPVDYMRVQRSDAAVPDGSVEVTDTNPE
ncbi:right-handed parallel beta-helix repeat-containing protein [bacterium]|nr:right-handed parallel beta-helix repeat-containing protein [bacterium]